MTFDYMKYYKAITSGTLASIPSKVLLLTFLISGFTCSDLFAQRGNNQIAIGLEFGPVVTNSWNEYRYQSGLPIKAYLGTGNHGQWMVRSGIHHLWFPSQDLIEPVHRMYADVVPLAFGYRRNIKNWYAEGSIGMAWERATVDYGNHDFGTVSSSQYPVNFGIEAGYHIHKFDFGVSLQNNLVRPRDETIFMVLVGFKAMYNIGI